MKHIISQKTIDHINDVCRTLKIEKYTINDDGSIDVDGDVHIKNINYQEFPIEFNIVSGDFYCYDNKLTTLIGGPKEVGGVFNCSRNLLTSLDGAPIKVGGQFICSDNKLTSLEYSPEYVGGWFNCNNNLLRSLIGCTKKCSAFSCTMNTNLTSLEGLPIAKIEEFTFVGNGNLPQDIIRFIFPWKHVNKESENEMYIFARYQDYYNVWTPEFNLDGFNDLINDIKDGLE